VRIMCYHVRLFYSLCAVVQIGGGARKRVALEQVEPIQRTHIHLRTHARTTTRTRTHCRVSCGKGGLTHTQNLLNSTTTWMKTQVQQLADMSGRMETRMSSSPRRIPTTTSISRASPSTPTTISMYVCASVMIIAIYTAATCTHTRGCV
jgi:hypothetical protein